MNVDGPVAVRQFNCTKCPERLFAIEYFHSSLITFELEVICAKCEGISGLKLSVPMKLVGGPLKNLKSSGKSSEVGVNEAVCGKCSELLFRFTLSQGVVKDFAAKGVVTCMACKAEGDFTINPRFPS